MFSSLSFRLYEFNDQILKLEEAEDIAISAMDYFKIRREITPICRAAQNMSATISRGYEMFHDDHGLLACRNLVATVERTAELLKEDATNGLEYFMAKQAESQALAAHRLNLVAAIFFPILAFASIFGMNMENGFEEQPRWVFWMFVAIGILIGVVMKTVIFRTRKHKNKERKLKAD